tara:strand:- start:190 stop:594 length:405 start_codon:yes stop_codon:yes gene_type:complete
MEITKVELPLSYEPFYACPNSGHNLLDETMQDAINDGGIDLAVHWDDPDEFVEGNTELVKLHEQFIEEENQRMGALTNEVDDEFAEETPTQRLKRFLTQRKLDKKYNLLEISGAGMGCGPIYFTQTFVVSKPVV